MGHMSRRGESYPLHLCRDVCKERLDDLVLRSVVVSVCDQRRDGDLMQLASDVVVLERTSDVKLAGAVPSIRNDTDSMVSWL